MLCYFAFRFVAVLGSYGACFCCCCAVVCLRLCLLCYGCLCWWEFDCVRMIFFYIGLFCMFTLGLYSGGIIPLLICCLRFDV